MLLKLTEILEKFGIKEYGFCDFSLLENDLLECAAKRRLPNNSNTVITCLFPYKVREEKPLNISRYAAVKDYHIVCGNILKNVCEELKKTFSEYEFEPFVDNSPIKEVKAAAYSGLGVIGKNNLLINNKYGSFCFIGEIVTDLKIQTVNNKITNCIKCGKCEKVCPSGFLSDKNKVCLSAVTQQKKPLNELEEKMITESGCIWGCDICQNCCPYNKKAETTNIEEFKESYRNRYNSDEDITDRAYAWRGKNVILRNSKLEK